MGDYLSIISSPTNATSIAIDRLNDHVSRHKINFSNDFLVQQGPHGTYISLKPKIKGNLERLNYKGEYSTTSAYAVYDVVRVISGNSYSITGSAVTPSVGTWVCVVPIPLYGYSGSSTADNRQSGVTYYPVSPESSSYANPYIVGSGGNGRFWEQLGGGTSTSGMNYRGSYTTASVYNTGDVMRKQYGSNQGVWVCVSTASVSGIDPVYPEPKTLGSASNTWEMLGLGVVTTTICNPLGAGSETIYMQATPP